MNITMVCGGNGEENGIIKEYIGSTTSSSGDRTISTDVDFTQYTAVAATVVQTSGSTLTNLAVYIKTITSNSITYRLNANNGVAEGNYGHTLTFVAVK